ATPSPTSPADVTDGATLSVKPPPALDATESATPSPTPSDAERVTPTPSAEPTTKPTAEPTATPPCTTKTPSTARATSCPTATPPAAATTGDVGAHGAQVETRLENTQSSEVVTGGGSGSLVVGNSYTAEVVDHGSAAGEV